MPVYSFNSLITEIRVKWIFKSHAETIDLPFYRIIPTLSSIRPSLDVIALSKCGNNMSIH